MVCLRLYSSRIFLFFICLSISWLGPTPGERPPGNLPLQKVLKMFYARGMTLTAAQHKTLQFIRKYIKRHGYSPTLDEIAMGRGLSSKGSMHREVRALADAGHIRLAPGRKRSIRLPHEDGLASPAVTLPLLGRIAAGKPIEAITDHETVNLSDFVMGRDRYCLLVMGESMVDAGILDGDTVIVESRNTANRGDIVVALIDNEEATLKRFRDRGDGSVELVAENPDIPNMIYTAQRVAIQGVVVGVLRSYR